MNQKTLSVLLKVVIIGVALCAAFVYCFLVPEMGYSLANAGDGEFADLYTPWLVVICITALPVAVALVLAWLIAANIGRGRSFCAENAKYLAVISVLALADSVYFFTASMALMFITKVGHPSVLIFTLMVCFVGVAICVAAAALSHYARKAYELEKQNELTI
ncbi:MAG: DUF2975 domain-containing protein [Clostridia bacterium]|nr:DUF2975 domain-containing protein [Clostridia bacterium]